ncbi:hypothetical protein HanIR_Chr05g0219161 [Helianthus annuus]|nr:hypothetical protein HanIR_Chr05g0219161 [Helianthus annuus]
MKVSNNLLRICDGRREEADWRLPNAESVISVNPIILLRICDVRCNPPGVLDLLRCAMQ